MPYSSKLDVLNLYKITILYIIDFLFVKIGQHHTLCMSVGQWEEFAGVDFLFVRVGERLVKSGQKQSKVAKNRQKRPKNGLRVAKNGPS